MEFSLTPSFSSGQFANDFLAAMGFFNGGHQLESVGGYDGTLVEVLVWSKTTLGSRMEAGKMTA